MIPGQIDPTPFNEWPEDQQDRLLDDVLRECPQPRPLHLGLVFWACFGAIVAFLIGLLVGMWFDFLVKRLS